MIYPNAGLPNELGEYDELPDTTAGFVQEWAIAGQVNVLGGCCGSTPAHIAAMAKAVAGLAPRKLPTLEPVTAARRPRAVHHGGLSLGICQPISLFSSREGLGYGHLSGARVWCRAGETALPPLLRE